MVTFSFKSGPDNFPFYKSNFIESLGILFLIFVHFSLFGDYNESDELLWHGEGEWFVN